METRVGWGGQLNCIVSTSRAPRRAGRVQCTPSAASERHPLNPESCEYPRSGAVLSESSLHVRTCVHLVLASGFRLSSLAAFGKILKHLLDLLLVFSGRVIRLCVSHMLGNGVFSAWRASLLIGLALRFSRVWVIGGVTGQLGLSLCASRQPCLREAWLFSGSQRPCQCGLASLAVALWCSSTGKECCLQVEIQVLRV